MDLYLVNYDKSAPQVVYLAYRVCRTKDIVPLALKLANGEIQPDMEMVKKYIAKGHESPLEHVHYTWLAVGVSRNLTHQLVRHRIASYSQYSHRSRDARLSFIVPDEIYHHQDEKVRDLATRLLDTTTQVYNSLVEIGVSPDSARYLLPTATSTNILYTFNARSLRNFLRLRCSKHASDEIHELASAMYQQVMKIHPWFYEDLQLDVKPVTIHQEIEGGDVLDHKHNAQES